MNVFTYKEKNYDLDSSGFLADHTQWDESFAEGMAKQLKIEKGLTKEHWDVIYSIRNAFKKKGHMPDDF